MGDLLQVCIYKHLIETVCGVDILTQISKILGVCTSHTWIWKIWNYIQRYGIQIETDLVEPPLHREGG